MPCYEVNLVTVEFKAANEGLLKAAAESLGYTFSTGRSAVYIQDKWGSTVVVIQNGKATAQDQDKVNALKRAYSVETIKQASKSKGWSGNWQELKEKNTVTVRKF